MNNQLIPAVVRELAGSVPRLTVSQTVSTAVLEQSLYFDLDLHLRRNVALQMGKEVMKYAETKREPAAAFDEHQYLFSVSRPLTNDELLVLLSRAYQAGRESKNSFLGTGTP